MEKQLSPRVPLENLQQPLLHPERRLRGCNPQRREREICRLLKALQRGTGDDAENVENQLSRRVPSGLQEPPLNPKPRRGGRGGKRNR